VIGDWPALSISTSSIQASIYPSTSSGQAFRQAQVRRASKGWKTLIALATSVAAIKEFCSDRRMSGSSSLPSAHFREISFVSIRGSVSA
jgi:hypothetical protein